MRLVQPGLPADILCVGAAQHAPDGQRPDKVAVIAFQRSSKVLRRCGRVRRAHGVRDTGDHIAVLEAVVAERLDDLVFFIGEDDISFVKELEDEPEGGRALADIEDDDPFEAVLADCKHFSPGDIFPQQHGELGRVLRGFGKVFYEMGPPAGLDDELVMCLVLPVQADAKGAAVELVDLVDPERQLVHQFGRNRPRINPAHSLFGCHDLVPSPVFPDPAP